LRVEDDENDEMCLKLQTRSIATLPEKGLGVQGRWFSVQGVWFRISGLGLVEVALPEHSEALSGFGGYG
jgi:hypothetical protein